MSVISALAQYPEITTALRSAQVAESAVAIVGKFKVARTELNTEMSVNQVSGATGQVENLFCADRIGTPGRSSLSPLWI